MNRAWIVPIAATFVLAAAVLPEVVSDPDVTRGMRVGAPEVESMGAMAFGPENVLFIGDSEGATILAVQIDEDASSPEGAPIELAGIDRRIAELLGTTPDGILIRDMAVHPTSRNVYVTVMRGRGADAQPVLLRVTRDRDRPIEVVDLENVRYSTASILNAPASDASARRNPRTFTVTDLAWEGGQVWVGGLSNEEFSSAFRRIPFPFGEGMATTTLEIYHVSHGQNETHAPVMTFMPRRIGGSLHILAAYTCTPLVAFPADRLQDGDHVFGRTVAELGAGNQPIDMIGYERDGRDYVLVANSRHPLMRVSTEDIAGAAALVSPTKEVGVARVPYEQPGITQLADLDADHIVVIQRGEEGGLDLRSIAKSTL